MSDEEVQRHGLLRAYSRYDEAQAAKNRQEQVSARVGLVLALIESGWEPPAEVQEQMQRDEKTLRRIREAEVLGDTRWSATPSLDQRDPLRAAAGWR